MKVIKKDNFDRETVSDLEIVSGISEHWAKRIADGLNCLEAEDSPDYFKAVPDTYKLYKYVP